jgi:hypothetical protein
MPAAAHAAGISKGRWSQVELGYESRTGEVRPVQGSDGTIARMAHAVGISPERLETEGGRPDAAVILREIIRRESEPRQEPADDRPPEVRANWHDPTVRQLWAIDYPKDRTWVKEGWVRDYLRDRDAAAVPQRKRA